MQTETILILEDNAERIAGFETATALLEPPVTLRVWREAHAFMAEAGQLLPSALLISLDHDLNRLPGATCDPGDGLEVASWLAQQRPVCPVIMHSSNHERVESMINELRFGGWTWDRVAPHGNDWIENGWQQKAEALIKTHRKFHPLGTSDGASERPVDHAARMERAALAFEGLSVGDAFGECFFGPDEIFQSRIAGRLDPPSPWFVTDDTVMATSVLEMLERFGGVERLALAKAFAARYMLDPRRGYGGTAHGILRQIHDGVSWIDAAGRAFDGMGSLGNGGAMRVAPLGAYFAGDSKRLVVEAIASAEVTHAHREGKAGAVAVAAAAGWVAGQAKVSPGLPDLLEVAYELTPDGETRRGIASALRVPSQCSPAHAAHVLGNGSRISAPDTVPVCLWLAARHLDDYREALWATASMAGDIDTNCAIVGGIVALAVGRSGIPAEWLMARERIPFRHLDQ
jgi:ADP-ribosylglycohydrolase